MFIFPSAATARAAVGAYTNLLLTMLLGGLWHGAGWTFVVWGGLHGIYLVMNHAYRYLRTMLGQDLGKSSLVGRLLSTFITFIAVVVGWVFFRATDMHSALNIINGMAGFNGVLLPESWQALLGTGNFFTFAKSGFEVAGKYDNLLVACVLVWLFPNTQQLMYSYHPALETFRGEINRHYMTFLEWKPNTVWAILISVIAIYVMLNLTRISEFLYFQF